MTATDWPALMEPVALELLGEPGRRAASTWRYRRKGSLAVHVGGPHRGTWRDHEADAGGGVLELLAHVEGLDRAGALAWLRQRGLLDDRNRPPASMARPGSRETAPGRGRTPPTPLNAALRGSVMSTRPPKDADSGRIEAAQAIWRAAKAISPSAGADHPARRWLAHRHLWRPDLALPPPIKWMPSLGWPSVGAIVAGFGPPTKRRRSGLTGVQLVHVDADGMPAPDGGGLTKRSIGRMSGAVCVLGRHWPAEEIHVAEGLADVLALAARLPWAAVCMGGTANYRNLDLALWLSDFRHVRVWADADGPGLEAARTLAQHVRGLGGSTVTIERVGAGDDPGSAGAHFPALDEGLRREYADDLARRDGMPRWEAERIASIICAPAGFEADPTSCNVPDAGREGAVRE